MTKLTAAARNKLKTSEFAEPSKRKYPINDATHARNALARVSQQLNKGTISEAEALKIKKKARAKLDKLKK